MKQTLLHRIRNLVQLKKKDSKLSLKEMKMKQEALNKRLEQIEKFNQNRNQN